MSHQSSALRPLKTAPPRLDDRVRNWKTRLYADAYIGYRCLWRNKEGVLYAFDIGFYSDTPRKAIAAQLRRARNQHRKDSHE